MSRPMVILSLGAGVQSSTLALMAARGEISPMPDCAIFADTQDEPRSVYQWLDWLEQQLPFPVYRVTAGRLSELVTAMRVTRDGRRFSKTSVPMFTRDEDGSHGMVTHRSCTYDFKILPIRRKVKAVAGIRRGEREVRVHQWIGISMDEVQRMKDSRDPWCKNVYPLVDRRITRQQCLAWMERQGYPVPPRSSCVYCPFHSDAEWRRLKLHEPVEFQRAVEFERQMQAAKAESANFNSVPYLHASRQPLDTVDFSTLEDHGQQRLWANECEGMCGL